MNKLRCMIYHNRRSPEGQPTLAFGLRVGYWPCLKGPFIALAAGPVSLDVWYGLPASQGKRDNAFHYPQN